ncbi:hypothetical protein MKW92_006908 [Papaver armeniacum]|nr:hypothetical protein MKW92_006908 [Papaver armeniacum]
MKQYNLRPNGGISTSLNLFATKFDEVVSVIEKHVDQLYYVLVDSPDQIGLLQDRLLLKLLLPLSPL